MPDDRAVGGVLGAGMSVDVFLTASVTVPEAPLELPAAPGGLGAPGASAAPAATRAPRVSLLAGYESGESTKITYQGVKILSRAGTYYILKVPLIVAEEISHLQAAGSAPFSLALRPDQDQRVLDVSALGATTNRIVQRYGVLIPETYPTLGRPGSVQPADPRHHAATRAGSRGVGRPFGIAGRLTSRSRRAGRRRGLTPAARGACPRPDSAARR